MCCKYEQGNEEFERLQSEWLHYPTVLWEYQAIQIDNLDGNAYYNL